MSNSCEYVCLSYKFMARLTLTNTTLCTTTKTVKLHEMFYTFSWRNVYVKRKPVFRYYYKDSKELSSTEKILQTRIIISGGYYVL